MEGLEAKDGVWAGLLALPYIFYQVYKTLKQDNKGDTVDSRISAFTTTLQTQLDKAIKRLDELQAERDKLAIENATLKAKLTIAEDQIMRVREGSKEISRQGV